MSLETAAAKEASKTAETTARGFESGLKKELSFSHWGIRALGNSLNLKDLLSVAGKASDPVLDKLNFTSNGWLLLGE